MNQPRDGAGDYGYDLVHEEVRRTGPRGRPPAPAPAPAPPAAGRTDREPAAPGDLGYDEAHDF